MRCVTTFIKCNNEATVSYARNLYCPMHARFAQMRASSKYFGKEPPSYEWLHRNISKDMICPVCGIKMNWQAKDGRASIITIQHDRDGEMRLICMSCNSKHYFMPGDSFFKLPNGHRYCRRCDQVLPLENFSKRASYCKICNCERSAEWRNLHLEEVRRRDRANHYKNRDKVLARQQARRIRIKLEKETKV